MSWTLNAECWMLKPSQSKVREKLGDSLARSLSPLRLILSISGAGQGRRLPQTDIWVSAERQNKTHPKADAPKCHLHRFTLHLHLNSFWSYFLIQNNGMCRRASSSLFLRYYFISFIIMSSFWLKIIFTKFFNAILSLIFKYNNFDLIIYYYNDFITLFSGYFNILHLFQVTLPCSSCWFTRACWWKGGGAYSSLLPMGAARFSRKRFTFH